MSVLIKTGYFQLNTTAGNVSVSGLGFQPKLILFFHTPDTTSIVNQTANHNLSIGATDGVNQAATCQFSSNGVGTESAFAVQTTTNCLVGSINSVNAWRASIVSMDGDGFTLNQPAGGLPPVGVRVGYTAIGGTLTGYKVGSFTLANATGAQSVTGLGFQPTGLIAFSAGRFAVTNNPTALVNQGNFMQTSFGFSDGTSSRVSGTWYRGATIGVTVRGRIQRNDSLYAGPYNTSPSTTYLYRGSLTSFDVDGFTVNNIINGNGTPIFYLAFAGAATKVGNFTTPLSTGPFAVTSLGFDPAGVILHSTWQGLMNTFEGFGAVANARGAMMSLGMATGPLNQYTVGHTTKDFTTVSVEGHHSENTLVMRRFAHDPFTTLELDFAHLAMGTGQLSFNCTTTSATTSVVSYMAIEGAAGGPPPPSEPTGGSGDINSPDSIFLQTFIGV